MTEPLEQAMQDDWERRENCHHDQTMTYDDTLYCFDCDSTIAVTCWHCGGEGYVHENEYECDWINYDDRMIVCPSCAGEGWEF